ncbi:hypothetical protein EV2_046483 [Malus domestica]
METFKSNANNNSTGIKIGAVKKKAYAGKREQRFFLEFDLLDNRDHMMAQSFYFSSSIPSSDLKRSLPRVVEADGTEEGTSQGGERTSKDCTLLTLIDTSRSISCICK